MMRVHVFSVMGALAAPSTRVQGERDVTFYTFGDYLKEFGKSYDEHEFVTRESVFQANLKAIKQHNAQANKDWYMTVNEFTDMTSNEFGSRLRAIPTISESLLVSTHIVTEQKTYPDSLDWRNQDGVLTDVKNQGACGSCWAFAAVETLESHYAIATGKPAPVLSAQELVSCSTNPDHCGGVGGCDGSTSELAFKYSVDHGLSSEMDFAYLGQTATCHSSKLKPCVKNGGYVRVADNDYTAHIDALQNGPLAIMIAANALQNYGGGILTKCDCDVNHAVQLTGYGSQNGKDYWLIRNSWGPDWGESGYLRVARFGAGSEPTCSDTTPLHGEACEGDDAPRTYSGLCGMLGATVYPTEVKGTGVECTAFNSTCPFVSRHDTQGLIDWCDDYGSGTVQSAGCSVRDSGDYFDCSCMTSGRTCSGAMPSSLSV